MRATSSATRCKPRPRTVSAGTKPVEGLDDPPALILRNAGPGVGHFDRRGRVDADTNLASFAAMFNGILNQVRYRAFDGRHIGAHVHRIGGIDRNRTAIHDCQGRQVADHPLAERSKVHSGIHWETGARVSL